MSIDQTKLALFAGAAVTTAGALLMLVWNPNSADEARLARLEKVAVATLNVTSASASNQDIGELTQQPIFIMTTGPGAYKERALQIFGIAVSPARRAALVAVDGAAPTWMTVGQLNGDIRLSAVGANGASFETPVGMRTITLSDATPTSAPTLPSGG